MTDTHSDIPEYAARQGRGGMLIRATVAQNVGMGCAFGGLGVSVLALQDRYDASLGVAAIGLSLTVLSMLALGPLVATLIPRWGLRIVMSCGVLVSLAGYVALAFAPSMTVALGICAVLIGPGVSLLSSLPPAMLVSSWYPDARGRVLGITYLPILVTILPPIGVYIIGQTGLTSFYLTLAALHLLLLPIVAGVREPPRSVMQAQSAAAHEPTGTRARAILGSGMFWLILLGDGILNGTNILGSAHTLPVATDYGLSLEIGALLLSITGGASMVGSLVAGYTCDRIGPARTLGIAALGFALAWAMIASTGWLPSFMVAAFIIGLCGAAVFPPVSALVVQIFGIDALPKTLGMLGIMTLPFTFSMSPAAGWLREMFGDYRPVFAILIATCMMAAACFFWLVRLTRTAGDRPATPELAMGPAKIGVQEG